MRTRTNFHRGRNARENSLFPGEYPNDARMGDDGFRPHGAFGKKQRRDKPAAASCRRGIIPPAGQPTFAIGPLRIASRPKHRYFTGFINCS